MFQILRTLWRIRRKARVFAQRNGIADWKAIHERFLRAFFAGLRKYVPGVLNYYGEELRPVDFGYIALYQTAKAILVERAIWAEECRRIACIAVYGYCDCNH